MMESARSDTARSGESCRCTEPVRQRPRPLSPDCECPSDEHGLTKHASSCLLWNNETNIYPHEVETCECYEPAFESGVCECCACLPDQCLCKRAGKEVFDEWRQNRPMGTMPAVLETTHPLMQKFQQTLKSFLTKENEIAAQEIQDLSDQLSNDKANYQSDLEVLYRDDRDVNAQRYLIEEYEAQLAEHARVRLEMTERNRKEAEINQRAKDQLEQDIRHEREATEEMEALDNLVRQLEKWHNETEQDLTISQRMSEKMRQEKKALAFEKRQLDMIMYGLNNEVWKLESKMNMYRSQIEIKNKEMDNVNDRVTAYAIELEDLELDKKRLVTLWNSVIINIKQRDAVYDSVRDDCNAMQENYRTLMHNLESTKKMLAEEITRSKELEMNKDKLSADLSDLNKLYEYEEARRETYEREIFQMTETIEMSERDAQMVKMENAAMDGILKATTMEVQRQCIVKAKMENEVLANLQQCLLNDKATEAMANGIKKMRDISRKLEMSLADIENKHAKLMLKIEMCRNRKVQSDISLAAHQAEVRAKQKELEDLREQYEQKSCVMLGKQRELDIVMKKYQALNAVFDMASPQERRITELEMQIKETREKTEHLQHEWLRLQGHVVRLTTQWHQLVGDTNLLHKQIQICDQKTMYLQAQLESVAEERAKTARKLRDLRGRLEVLERARNEAATRNDNAKRTNIAITAEYSSSLKDAEDEILEIEEEIEAMDKQKMDLTQELDHVQREALIWQRKGILAVELKRNIKAAKSGAGEIGLMKHEIHRMEVRREQLRQMSDKLSNDIAQYVTRRETAIDKSRALAAVEKSRGTKGQTSQVTYHHKLRLAKSDLTRITKDLEDAKAQMKQLLADHERLAADIDNTTTLNAQLEEQVASLLSETRECERHKQWLLERVVRSQRLGSELTTAVKRQSVRVKKSKPTVMAEYKQARALNDRLKYIVEELSKSYPHMDEKFETVSNTLNIFTPDGSPRLTEEAPCELVDEEVVCEYHEEEIEVEEDPCHCD